MFSHRVVLGSLLVLSLCCFIVVESSRFYHGDDTTTTTANAATTSAATTSTVTTTGSAATTSDACQDVEGWFDSKGPSHDCDFYQAEGEAYCTQTGDMYGNLGLTAKKACCACGGGIQDPVATAPAIGWQLFIHRQEYFWAVNAIEMYSSADCSDESRIQIPSDALFFDSGNRGSGFGPERPFVQGYRWAGRKDSNGNHYLGVELNAPVTVRCLRVHQNGRGVPRIMILAKRSSNSPWTNVKYATGLEGGWSTIVLDDGNSNDPGLTPTTTTTTTSTTTTTTTTVRPPPVTTTTTVRPPPPAEPTISDPTDSGGSLPLGNPIEVPASLLPAVMGATPASSELYCRYWDLTSIKPPQNPGIPDEAIGDMVLSGDDIWETSFYMMLYSNCERQVRGLEPFAMWSNDIMVRLQPTYVFESGHKKFGERAGIVRGVVAEGAGGAQRVGAPIPSRRIARGEDTIPDMIWNPLESARVAVAGLVNHGDAMRDAMYTCVWATVTLGPEANDWMSAILLYGRSCI